MISMIVNGIVSGAVVVLLLGWCFHLAFTDVKEDTTSSK